MIFSGLKIKMNVQISLALLLVVSVISLEDDGDSKKARKHYGLSFHSKCTDYVKSFTCMTTCKSIGFRVYRLDFRCKCSCHELKTTTILPFFKWRTNGTTQTLPSTQSPNLYHIAGTISPARIATTSESNNQTDKQTTTIVITSTYEEESATKAEDIAQTENDTKAGDPIETDSTTDTTPESGSDTTPESGSDTTPESGSDTTPESGSDTTPESGSDTTPESGSDTTPADTTTNSTAEK